MNCEHFESLIAAEVDGEISAADQEKLLSHLAECSSCEALAAACRDQDREIREAFTARVRSAAELTDRCAAMFDAAPIQKPSNTRWALAAAALLLGFGLGWFTSSPGSNPAEGPGLGSDAVATGGSHPAGSNPAGSNPADDSGSKPPVPAPAPPARLAFATGPVQILELGSNDWKPLAPDGAIPAESRVRSVARCELHVDDGSILRLDADAEVTLASARSWKLERGRVWTNVAAHDDEFEFLVDDTKVSSLNTRFEVERKPGGDLVNVFEGTTTVSLGESNRVVRPGEQARVGEGISISQINSQKLTYATSWMNELLILRGESDPELASRLEELLAGVGHQKMTTLFENEIRSLGTSCVVPLIKYLRSPRSRQDMRRRVKAALIIKDLATEDSIDDLVELLSDSDGDVRAAAASALKRVTGKDFGRSAREWKNTPWSHSEATFLKWRDWAKARKSKAI